MTQPITRFSGAHAFLSNFFVAPILFTLHNGQRTLLVSTVEHAYQASKTTDPAKQLWIASAPTPAAAKSRGGSIPDLLPDWDNVRDGYMRFFLGQKFSLPHLLPALLATGDAVLIEGNTWGDRYWGCVYNAGHWDGQNRLGKLLMALRDELRAGNLSPQT